MSANPRLGRFLKVKWDGTLIAAVMTKGIKINGSPVDTTNDDDAGYRSLLAASGTRSIDISVEGVWKSQAILDDVMGDDVVQALEIESLDEGGISEWTVTGNFRVNGLEINGETAEKVKFSCELQSTGAFTYTPA